MVIMGALLTTSLSLYLGQYAVGRFLWGVQYTALIGSCIYGALVLFGDSAFYTSVLGYYQLLLVLCIVSGITGLFRNMPRPTKEQSAALYGITVFFIASLGDIVMYSGIFGDRRKIPVSETAMRVFVLAQTVSLFFMNSRVLGEAKKAERSFPGRNTPPRGTNPASFPPRPTVLSSWWGGFKIYPSDFRPLAVPCFFG